MTSTSDPARGDIRFTDAGDLEIFDGGAWVPVGSVVTDPELGHRDPFSDGPVRPRDLGPPKDPEEPDQPA